MQYNPQMDDTPGGSRRAGQNIPSQFANLSQAALLANVAALSHLGRQTGRPMMLSNTLSMPRQSPIGAQTLPNAINITQNKHPRNAHRPQPGDMVHQGGMIPAHRIANYEDMNLGRRAARLPLGGGFEIPERRLDIPLIHTPAAMVKMNYTSAYVPRTALHTGFTSINTVF